MVYSTLQLTILQCSVLTFSLFLGSMTVGVEQRELTQSSRSPPGVTTSSLLPRGGRARARGLQGERLPSRPGRDRRLQGEDLVRGGYFTRHIDVIYHNHTQF